MAKFFKKAAPVFLALCIAAGSLGLGVAAATGLRESPLATQSKVLRSILSEDAVGITSFLTSKEKRSMLRGFLKAVADAYVNFEMIPVNEGKRFTAIFTSINDDVYIESFQYYRHDLHLAGVATPQGYERFLAKLRTEEEFYQIEEIIFKKTKNNQISFIINCKAPPLITPPIFGNE